MKKTIVLIMLFPVLALGNGFWGKTGHRVTGAIAQNHLNGKAKKALNELLDGQSLAFVSTFGDDIKADQNFKKYDPWHYVNYPMGMLYRDSEKSDQGDIITAIETCMAIVANNSNSR